MGGQRVIGRDEGRIGVVTILVGGEGELEAGAVRKVEAGASQKGKSRRRMD